MAPSFHPQRAVGGDGADGTVMRTMPITMPSVSSTNKHKTNNNNKRKRSSGMGNSPLAVTYPSNIQQNFPQGYPFGSLSSPSLSSKNAVSHPPQQFLPTEEESIYELLEEELVDMERGRLRKDPTNSCRYRHCLLRMVEVDPKDYLLPRLDRSQWKRFSVSVKHAVAEALVHVWQRQTRQHHNALLPHSALQYTGMLCDAPRYHCPTTNQDFVLVLGASYQRHSAGLSPRQQNTLITQLLQTYQVSSLEELPRALEQELANNNNNNNNVNNSNDTGCKDMEVCDTTSTTMTNSQQQHQQQTIVNDRLIVLQDLLWSTTTPPQEQQCPFSSNQTVHVAPFLVAVNTTSYSQARRHLTSSSSSSSSSWFRLPLESEWEYVARGGGWDLMYPYDCQLPLQQQQQQQQQQPSSRSTTTSLRNALGLLGLNGPMEVCQMEAASTGNDTGVATTSVVGRGGSDVWSLISARRSLERTGSLQGEENILQVRLALDVLP